MCKCVWYQCERISWFLLRINFIKSYAYTIVHSVLCCDVQCAHTHSWWKVSSTKCYSAQGESSQQQRKRDFTVSCNKPHIFCWIAQLSIFVCVFVSNQESSLEYIVHETCWESDCALFSNEITFLQFLPISISISSIKIWNSRK